MKLFKMFVIMLGLFSICNTTIYAQYDNLDVLYTINDPSFPESGLNAGQVGDNVCHLGDINDDGFDDWAIGLRAAVDYQSGLTTGTVHIYFGGDIPESESASDLIIGGQQGQYGFGSAISGAGDVNNDGYDDFIVRYTKEISDEEVIHSVALFYGGNPVDRQVDLIFTAVEGHADYWFGTLSDAGDVNNDGFDDIIIGAPTQVTGPDTGHVYLYYGGQSMDNIADVIFTGDFTPVGPPSGGASNFGLSISGAGDMNNDGFDDIIINAGSGGKLYLGGTDMDNIVDVLFNDLTGYGTGPIVSGAGDVNNDGYDDVVLGAKVAGQAYICYGGDPINNVSDVFIPGWADWDYFGHSVSGAGDVNGDGIDDVVIGSDYQDMGMTKVYFGSSPTMNNIADVEMVGPLWGDRFGYTVSGGGDLDGDGYNDIIVGGIGDYTSFSSEDDAGNVWLFYGGNPMDSVAEAVFTGISGLPYFGHKASHAGDVNNDGFPDVLVGEPSYYANGYYVGRAYLYLGNTIPDNTPDLVLMSENSSWHHNFGGLVRNVGDVNNDNYSDVILAETNSNDQNRTTYLYLGGEFMDSIPDLSLPAKIEGHRPDAAAGVGDVNNDGYDDILITNEKAYLFYGGEAMDNIADVIFDSTDHSASGAGDLNGDDISDFIIGGYNDDESGIIKVFYGNTSLNNTPALILERESWNYYSAKTIAGGHDINNDGYDDIVTSQWFYDKSPEGDEGRVYIYYGGESMDTTADVTITGDSVEMNLGKKVMSIPDLNADGYDEVLISHSRHFGEWGESSELYIYYGGVPMDTIPDIVLPHSYENDVSVYSHPTEGYVGIVVGDPNLSAILIYTNSNLSGISQDENVIYIPLEHMLYQNYPNPFNPVTTINYQLPITNYIDLSIYNLLGQKVATLVSKHQQAGAYQVEWDARGFASGVYIYHLQAEGKILNKKMFLLK